MATIMVTGCAGFIGSHLTENLLKKGFTVVGVDNFDPFYNRSTKEENMRSFSSHPNFIFYELDISHKGELQQIKKKIDVVIHLAAKAGVLPSLKDPSGYIRVNITGTNNILEFMREMGTSKMLFASSSSIYGNTKEIPFVESALVNKPISPYAFTKKACELMNYSYHHLYGMDILNLRLFTVYGPRQRPDLAIHKFTNLIIEGKPIQMYGDGSTARDYTFVHDTVNGFEKALTYIMRAEGVYDIINLGNKHPVKLSDLIAYLYELMDCKPEIQQKPMQPGDVDITFADISKAQQLFGYSPSTDIKEGLLHFTRWFNEQRAQKV